MIRFVNGGRFKDGVEVPPHRKKNSIPILCRREHAYDHQRVSIDNKMTTPRSCFHDTTTLREKIAVFISSDLQIIIITIIVHITYYILHYTLYYYITYYISHYTR